ncbi:MAG: hypothetical protein AAF580_15335 [Pseudomonadota bacterium]
MRPTANKARDSAEFSEDPGRIRAPHWRPSFMKTTVFAVAMIALGATAPALAQDTAMPAAEAPAAEAAAEKLTIDNSIEELMGTEATSAILLKHIPGLNEHPAYDQFKGMSLIELQPWSAGAVTDEIIAAVTADLEALA